jgi:CO dehydrogenase nickel-insertion accessory protein CooC1
MKRIAVVGNKIQSEAQKQFIRDALPNAEFLGFIPFDEAIIDADLAKRSITDSSLLAIKEVKIIFQTLLSGGVVSTDKN